LSALISVVVQTVLTCWFRLEFYCFSSFFRAIISVSPGTRLSTSIPHLQQLCCTQSRGVNWRWNAKQRLRLYFRLHRMHEMQTAVADVRGVCQSACLSRGSTRLYCAEVIWCSFFQITLASCYFWFLFQHVIFFGDPGMHRETKAPRNRTFLDYLIAIQQVLRWLFLWNTMEKIISKSRLYRRVEDFGR